MKKIIGKIRFAKILIKYIKNWPTIFLNYFKILNDKHLIFKLRNGKNIKIKNAKNKYDTSGIATIYEIFLMNNYCPKGMEINENDIIIDIGANIGIFSIYASQKARKGKIYSYEPFPSHYKRMVENIKLNKISNIYPFNLAVCKKEEKRDLFINEECSGMHSIILYNRNQEKIEIDCISLENIFIKNNINKCNFLKIDCEGAEYEIIYNTPKNILKRIEKISLEFDNIDKDKKNCLALKNFLEKHNFSVSINGADKHQGILYAKNKIFKE